MDMKARSPISLAVVLVLLVCSGRAQAAGRESKERAAHKACLSGEVSKGIQLLSDLYLDTKNPTFIYNQGRCFETNHQYEDAAARFREYLFKQPDLPESEKAETQKHIEACQGFLGKTEDRPQPAVAAAPPPAPIPAPAAAPAPEAMVQATAATPMASSEAGAGLRSAGAIAAVVGGGGLIAGLAFNLKANSLANDVRAHYDPSKVSSHGTYVTLGWIGYGAGAACVAGGAVLYYLGWRDGDRGSKVALVPSAGPGVAGLVLTGAM
jgi:hypothetical protein